MRCELMSTRLYIILLIISISIIIFYTVFSTTMIHKTIQLPSQEQYEELEKQYSTTLKCSCTNISISYGDFFQISPVYHQICSSDFIKPWWYKQLVTSKPSNLFNAFRSTASSHFQMLATLCELANLTVIDATRRFFSTYFINSEVPSSDLFASQTQAILNTFISSTQDEFIYIPSMVRTALHANQYVSFENTNSEIIAWDSRRYGISSENPLQLFPFSKIITLDNNKTCICARNSSCTTLATLNNLPTIYGLRTGCFIIDSVFQSSLACWYNSSCWKDILEDFHYGGAMIPNNMNLLDTTQISKFPPNTAIEIIVRNIMIEQWNTSASYNNFYQKCHPAYCLYNYQEKTNAVFLLATIIGLIGGLNVILRLISPLIINMFFKNTNIIAPDNLPQAWTTHKITNRKSK
ncbi:unnamed protein product [Rotaria sp. Silwood2]|nr:unnamed protein product [Rotaria sp. Silwood2]CAF4055875.1 unnamed protein product [Rotaria sp. Silwood2]